MKKLKKIKSIGIITLLISILLLSSCSTSPDNLKVIPKETNLVSVIDFYSLFKKGQLDEISEMKMFKTFKKEIKSENKKLSKIFNNFTEDPTSTGINFTSDIIMFYIDEARDEQYAAMSIEIKDDEKFEEFLEDILDELDIDYDIEKEENYTYALVNDYSFSWDEDKMVLLVAGDYDSSENLEDIIETIMELEEEDQISKNEEFDNFYKEKKDISFWVSSNLMESSMFGNEFEEMIENIDYDIEDNYASLFINFDDDNISFKTNFTPNSELQKLMDENDFSNSFNNDLLKNFPNKNNLVASISMNPMALYNIIEQQDVSEDLESEFEELDLGLDLKELFESFKGNAVFSLFGSKNFEYTYMSYGYGFNESEAVLLDEKYEISKAGDLSTEDKELLNQGKTIQCREFSRRFCINIKNILDNGDTIETAIKNDEKINWYEGGWEYGPYIEETGKENVPLMGMTMDLNGNKTMKKLVKKMLEENEEIKKRGDYYETKLDRKYPVFLAFDEKVCFITNDKKSIKKFKDGYDDSLSNSEMSNNMFYGSVSLDLEDYPKELRKKMEDDMTSDQKKGLKIWNEFAKSVELKVADNYSYEMTFNMKESDTNSLNTIITLINDNYKKLMTL